MSDKKKENESQDLPDENITISRQEHESLLKRLAELEQLKDRLLLSAADFENAKKRLSRERDEFVKFSQESLIRDLVPVLDNFDRALSHAGEANEKNLKSIVSGVQMVQKQLSEILKNQGLKKITTLGEKFDPHRHEAVSFAQEEGPDDIIVAEVESGYMLHERLLRASKVRVRVANAVSSDDKQEETN